MRRSSGALVVGALVLLFGIYSGYTNRCLGNFGNFSGVTCSLWGIPVPEAAFWVIGWGLILAGIGILVVAILVRSGETPEAAPSHPSK